MPIPAEFYQFQRHLPPTGWFIAGGSLLDTYNDIDIYFESKADFVKCLTLITSAGYKSSYQTDAALTFGGYNRPTDPWRIDNTSFQLVVKSFGTPEQILSDFDLNKSRQAVLPSGKLYQHYTFFQDLYFEPSQFKFNTLDRFFKYAYDKHQPIDFTRLQSNIAQLLADPDATYGYYYDDDQRTPQPLSAILSRQFSSDFVLFGWLLPVFESLPADQRLALYQHVIAEWTEVSITPDMSAELQVVLALRDNVYKHYQRKLTHDTPLEHYSYIKHYPPQTPTVDVWSIYPELFI